MALKIEHIEIRFYNFTISHSHLINRMSMAPHPDEICPVCSRSYDQSSGNRTRRKLIGTYIIQMQQKLQDMLFFDRKSRVFYNYFLGFRQSMWSW